MNPATEVPRGGNRLASGWLTIGAICTGGIGAVVLMAMRFGRWPRNTLARFVVFTAAGLGAVGAIVGLIVGLNYPPTAAFAVVELGLPSAIAGALVGLLLGSLTVGIHGALRYRRG